MPYLGNTPSTSFATVVKDSFSGDGSTVAFTLSKVATTNSVSVFVENVRQEPTTAYAVSGTTLTFTAAPVSSSGNNIYVLHMNPTTTTTHPAAQNLTAVDGTFTGTVTAGSTLDMNGTELILDADADTSITADTDDQVDIKVAGSDLAHITSTYAKLRGATPLVFGENNSTGTFQSISGEVGANNLLLRSYQSLTFKNGTSGSSLTDGTTAFNIDTNGIVTMPKQPCFRAQRQNASGGTQGFTSTITFNREVLDLNADYDPSNGRFTAPVDGTYYFTHGGLGASGSSASVHTTGASWHLEYLKNGARTGFQFYWYQGHPSAGGTQSGYVNSYLDLIITLSAGDYIQVQLPDGTDSYYSDTSTYYEAYFQGFLVG